MADEKRMNFYRTFYDLTTLLPEAERRKVNTALLDYFFEGIEPKGLSESGMKVFRGCEGRVSKSRTNAANVANRYGDSKPTDEPTNVDTNNSADDASDAPTEPLPEREREREVDKEGAKERGKAARFRAPSPAEVAEYAEQFAADKGLDLTALDFDPERFVDFYAQKGWMVGRSHMKDWKATVRNWLRTSKPRNGSVKEVPDDGFSAYD
nr:MAG TPA: DNA-binding domain protein [Caudoviricetes sp.]